MTQHKFFSLLSSPCVCRQHNAKEFSQVWHHWKITKNIWRFEWLWKKEKKVQPLAASFNRRLKLISHHQNLGVPIDFSLWQAFKIFGFSGYFSQFWAIWNSAKILLFLIEILKSFSDASRTSFFIWIWQCFYVLLTLVKKS